MVGDRAPEQPDPVVGRRVDPELRPLDDVVRGWRREGYSVDFEVRAGGRLGVQDGEQTYAPEDVSVDHQHRYEGRTDPGDEELLMAVTAPDGTRGTLTLAYGVYASADEAEVARRLPSS